MLQSVRGGSRRQEYLHYLLAMKPCGFSSQNSYLKKLNNSRRWEVKVHSREFASLRGE